MDSELVLTLLKIFGVFAALSFVVFWVGLVWWVSQDVTSRTTDKIILAAAVAFATIFGPVGVLLYLIVRPRQTMRESYREMLETEINRKLASMDMAFCPFCGANLERDSHTPHPDQLSIASVDISQEIAEPLTMPAKVSGQSQKISRSGKLMSVKITETIVRATKATVKGATYLLTPLPDGKAKKSTVQVDEADTVSTAVADEQKTESVVFAKTSNQTTKAKTSHKPAHRGGSAKRGKR